jgi:hypothetical protein
MLQAKAIKAESQESQARFNSWLKFISSSKLGDDGISDFTDLPSHYSNDVGPVIDLITVRVPSTMPSVGKELWVQLANNIITHAKELYGSDVHFTTSHACQLCVCRVFSNSLGVFSIKFGRDGQLLSMEIHYESIVNNGGTSINNVADTSRASVLEFAGWLISSSFVSLPVLGALALGLEQNSETAAGSCFVAFLFAAAGSSYARYGWSDEMVVSSIKRGIAGFILCSLCTGLGNDVGGLVMFLLASILTLLNIWRLYTTHVSIPWGDRKHSYLSALRNSAFQVSSGLNGDVEGFLSKNRNDRNFFQNMLDHVQLIRNMMQSAAS